MTDEQREKAIAEAMSDLLSAHDRREPDAMRAAFARMRALIRGGSDVREGLQLTG